MSEVLRIGLVAEGETDYIVLSAAVEAILGDQRAFDIKLLQPDTSAAFEQPGHAGELGGGWRGVVKWCRRRIPLEVALTQYDLVVVHLDADVATEDEEAFGLPCEHPCPPPADTTNALRGAALRWMDEPNLPDRVVFCTPSKSIEAWMMRAFFPEDRDMRRRGWECHPSPESRLAQQPVRRRFRKSRRDYRSRAKEMAREWPRITATLTEAQRFEAEFEAALDAGYQ